MPPNSRKPVFSWFGLLLAVSYFVGMIPVIKSAVGAGVYGAMVAIGLTLGMPLVVGPVLVREADWSQVGLAPTLWVSAALCSVLLYAFGWWWASRWMP